MWRHRRASAITVGRLCVAQIAVPIGKVAIVPHSLGLADSRGAEVRGGVSKFAVIAWVLAMASPASAGPALLFDATDFFFQAEDGIRDYKVTGVQTCALPI